MNPEETEKACNIVLPHLEKMSRQYPEAVRRKTLKNRHKI